MEQINIALESFGILLTAILLFCCAADRAAGDKRSRCLITMLSVNLAVLLCDLLTWVLAGQAALTLLLYAANFLVFSLGYILTALFTHYLTDYLSQRTEISTGFTRHIDACCLVAILLVVLSLFNHMYFRFDDGVYVRGPWFWLSQVYPVALLTVDMTVTLRYRRILGVRDLVALLSYTVLPVLALLIQTAIYGVTLLYLATTLSLTMVYIMIHAEQSRRFRDQELALAQAQTAIMLSQIQPHFLYNTLEAIGYLCQVDPSRAEQAVTEFSMFLRGNMDSLTHRGTISFEQELLHTRNYLALEKVRFEEQLQVVYDIRATLFYLPPLTLQPIVENAVRYGVTKREDGGTVEISSEETATAFVVTIRDDGIGFDPMAPKADGRTHIGIQNVRNRLETQLHGTLEIVSTPGVGTVATITIPRL